MNRKILAIFFSALILVVLLASINWQSALSAIGKVDPLIIFLVLVLYAAGILVNGAAVALLLRPSGLSSWRNFFDAFAVSWCAGSFLPARAGDFALALFHDSIGVPRRRIVVNVLVDKLITLFVICLLAWVGLVFWYDRVAGIDGVAWTATAILGGLAGGLLVFYVGKDVMLQRIRGRWGVSLQDFLGDLSLLQKNIHVVLGNVFLTGVRLAIQGISFWLLLQGLGVSVSPILTILFLSISTLSVFTPFTFNGTGIKESLIVFLFQSLGVAGEVALSAALLQLILTYVWVGFFAIVYRRKIGELFKRASN